MSSDIEIIKCPICKKEMKKVFISDADMYIDICIDGCSGVFFDKKEVWHFDKIVNNVDSILNQLNNHNYSDIDKNKTCECPSCGAKMVKFGIEGVNEPMDICCSCGSRFLTYSVLKAINEIKDNYTQALATESQNPNQKKSDVEVFMGDLNPWRNSGNFKIKLFSWSLRKYL